MSKKGVVLPELDNPVILPELEETKPVKDEIRFRTYYDKKGYEDVAITFDPNLSLTDQDFKCMTDVNYLLEHMAGHSRTPIYGVQDKRTFEDWSNEMALVKRKFMDLTPDMQRQFGNAQNFLMWCADPNNYKDQLPSVVEGRLSKEKQERDSKRAIEKAELYAKKVAEFINNKE